MIAFADTAYFLGLMHPGDQFHAQAKDLAMRVERIVTTQYVLVEVASAFCRANNRWRFIELLALLADAPNVRVVEANNDHFKAGVDFYERRMDKDWSLTDCTSFVVMEREGITDALTADHHFEQAGFVALLK